MYFSIDSAHGFFNLLRASTLLLHHYMSCCHATHKVPSVPCTNFGIGSCFEKTPKTSHCTDCLL